MSEFIIMKNRIFVIFKGVRRLFEQVHSLSNIDYSILYYHGYDDTVGRITIQMHISRMYNGISHKTYAGTTFAKSHQYVYSGYWLHV